MRGLLRGAGTGGVRWVVFGETAEPLDSEKSEAVLLMLSFWCLSRIWHWLPADPASENVQLLAGHPSDKAKRAANAA